MKPLYRDTFFSHSRTALHALIMVRPEYVFPSILQICNVLCHLKWCLGVELSFGFCHILIFALYLLFLQYYANLLMFLVYIYYYDQYYFVFTQIGLLPHVVANCQNKSCNMQRVSLIYCSVVPQIPCIRDFNLPPTLQTIHCAAPSQILCSHSSQFQLIVAQSSWYFAGTQDDSSVCQEVIGAQWMSVMTTFCSSVNSNLS